MGQEASEEQGDGGVPAGGAGGGGQPPGSDAAHPRPHGLRQGPHAVIHPGRHVLELEVNKLDVYCVCFGAIVTSP